MAHSVAELQAENVAPELEVIRSKGQKPRFYAPAPIALAAALNFEAGEQVQWVVLDRKELHLARPQAPKPPTPKRAKR